MLVPSTFLLLRERRWAAISAAAIWLACVGFVFGALRWFEHQAFSQQEKIIRGPINYLNVYNLKLFAVKFSLGLSFYLLPVLIAFLTGFVLRRRRYFLLVGTLIAGIALAIVMGLHSSHMPAVIDILAPFDGGFFGETGAVDVPEIGSRPIILGPHIRFVVTLISLAATLSFVCFLCHAVFIRKHDADIYGESDTNQGLSWRQLAILAGPFTLAYSVLLIPRGLYASIADRYMLPLLVMGLIVTVRVYQQRVRPDLPAITLVTLGVFAFVGIAATHDKFAIQRAQLTAVQEILDAGVARSNFYGGFEYDGWTQIDEWGYVNNDRINFPSGFHPLKANEVGYPCEYMSSVRLFPAIHPRYAISFSADACQGLAQFKPVSYRSWLPPYAGSIYVVKIAKPAYDHPPVSTAPANP